MPNAIIKHLGLLVAVLLSPSYAHSSELTGRFSMLGTTAQAEQGDSGYTGTEGDTLTADQQSLRLMFEDAGDDHEWSVHLKVLRQHLSGYSVNTAHSSDLFRYRTLSGDWLDEQSGSSSTRIGYEFDRAVYKHRFGAITLGLGRQPIDWGSGRLWQPLNVFGAFSPTDLDTDFKPGIDAATFDWYPSAFSSLTAIYVMAPSEDTSIEDSGAVYYRRQVGEGVELSMLAGGVIGNNVVGASVEGSWAGMGWRIEGAHYDFKNSDKNTVFWIAGIDHQFDNGTLVTVEWYDNSRGTTTESALPAAQNDSMVAYGLQPQLGRQVLGATVARDITPLLNASYTLLMNTLDDADHQMATSLLHQLNLKYSVSNESDLLFSLLLANGKGLDSLGRPRSEFGHLPASMTLRLRFYF